MRLQVRAKVRAVRKRPIAVIARERLLARVGAYVALEQPRPRKSLPAHGALAGQRVRPDVHLQRAKRHVHFLAVLAAELLPGAFAGGAVELSVLRQPGERGVTFPAIGTLVPDPLPPLL